MLRQEIDNSAKLVHKYVMLTCGGVFATLAYVLNNPVNPNNPLIFIVLFAALICIAPRINNLSNDIIRMSTYILVFLEPKIDGRNWEIYSWKEHGNNRNKITNEKADKRNFFLDHLFFKSNSTCLLLGIITYSIHFALLFKNCSLSIIELIVPLFNTMALLILGYISKTTNDTYNRRVKSIRCWEEVKTQVEEKKHTGNWSTGIC